MKYFSKIAVFFFSGLFVCQIAFAQVPQAISYQSVARNAGGNVLANTAISVRINITTMASGGMVLYSERHDVTTNQFGLFTIAIGAGTPLSGSFSGINWAGGNRYAETALDSNGATGGYTFTVMGTMQLLSVPYALLAQQVISGATLDQAYDAGGAGSGRIVNADAGAVEINSGTNNGIALDITHSGNGVAISAEGSSPSSQFAAIQSVSSSNSGAASAIIGSSSGMAYGVSGQLETTATAQSAVYGNNLRTNGGHGVRGIGFNGVVGETNYSQGFGLYGENYDQLLPLGNGVGVAGTGFYGVLGEDRYLGSVTGAYGVFSNGNFAASGTKSFVIDHPLDPENRFLKHFSMESNEVLNVYRGNAVFDQNNEAAVTLPSYFNSINTNFTYQLTPVGGYAPLYIKEKIQNNRFVIGGGTEGLEVSWVVYAERNDAYLQQHPEQKQPEQAKRPQEQGKYLMPQLYGKLPDEGLFYVPKPATLEQQPLPVLKTQVND
ncbi:hypothetical protein C7N43_39285 [Sphingobacteriales bacterium UPWRP_1]|nr:hypothetical protein BVG80_12045 [Sphingobacteriales bacterium TSM_CSM]PSJ71442.1 hypothetical protein C7N43_39285 [Sphingobacteriales bacterium UPWRP_1]